MARWPLSLVAPPLPLWIWEERPAAAPHRPPSPSSLPTISCCVRAPVCARHWCGLPQLGLHRLGTRAVLSSNCFACGRQQVCACARVCLYVCVCPGIVHTCVYVCAKARACASSTRERVRVCSCTSTVYRYVCLCVVCVCCACVPTSMRVVVCKLPCQSLFRSCVCTRALCGPCPADHRWLCQVLVWVSGCCWRAPQSSAATCASPSTAIGML